MYSSYVKAIQSADLVRRTGRVKQFFGLVVEADGPEAFLGERCEIYSKNQTAPVLAEVVGIKGGSVLLMPYDDLQGIALGSEVIATGRKADVPVGEGLLGRVIDPFGKPLDGRPAPEVEEYYPLYKPSMNPLDRPRIKQVLETGVRAIDSMATIGRGQRMGIFAGSGVGKSSLLGMIARNMDADINVIAMIGERGREVLDFVEDILGKEGLQRSVVIVATSDQSPLLRVHAAWVATAIAEYYRDKGSDVVLTMDSVTRFAMAQRELGLAVGEPPTSRGYTPSVFSQLPRLMERGGNVRNGGSISAFYTVLVEADDLNDPIADSVRSILDGGIVLSRDLANERHYPPIDILHSNSRLMANLVNDKDLSNSQSLAKMLSLYERSRDMVDLGAYRSGSNPELDKVLKLLPEIKKFLCQSLGETISKQQAMRALQKILGKQV